MGRIFVALGHIESCTYNYLDAFMVDPIFKHHFANLSTSL